MSIEKTIEEGDMTVEIDDWGGCHFHVEVDDPPLSLSPRVMERIETARNGVLNND